MEFARLEQWECRTAARWHGDHRDSVQRGNAVTMLTGYTRATSACARGTLRMVERGELRTDDGVE